jgi:hypothetical protein
MAVALALIRRESTAVICRFAVFRRDARPLIGKFERAWAAGRWNTEDQTPKCIEAVPEGSSEHH